MGLINKMKTLLFRKGTRNEALFFKSAKEKFFIDGKALSVGQFFRRAVDLHRWSVALIDKDKNITYHELWFRALSIAKLLDQNGVKCRDKVLVYCENSVEFYIFYYATWLRGAVTIPVNTFLHEKELAHVIRDAAPKCILTQTKFEPVLAKILDNELVSSLPPRITEKAINWESFHSGVEDIFVNDNLDPDELALLLYTSGTSGVPKGVMLSSKNIITNAIQDYARLRLFSCEKECFFAVLPLFHVFAQNTCVWLPLMTGSSVIVVHKIERQNIIEGLLKKPTIFFGFPALFGLLCLMKNAPISSIKIFVSGADAMPDKVRAAFAMIYGRKICSGYGLTEASPVIAINHDDENAPTDGVGRPLYGITCDIRDEEGKSLPIDSIGSLWVKGDNIMLGYFNAPHETERVLKDGWLNTGDLASISREGELAIRGRTKDIIIHKGFNIYPQEVENVLMLHPAVTKVAVVGKAEAVSGQVPIAFVATREDKVEIEKSLKKLCMDNLAAYKIPRKIICLDDLPMSPSGKVDKKRLQL
jgi:long-chain acyl-CoA synthetase